MLLKHFRISTERFRNGTVSDSAPYASDANVIQA